MAIVTQKDTAWSIFIAVVCTIAFFIALGMSYSAGIYYVAFQDEFKASPSSVSWVSSINLGCTCVFGPIISTVMMKLGSRVTMLIGAVFASLGLALSAFATNIYWLYCTFGVLSGTGIGFIYQTIIATIPMFFEKYRSGTLGFVTAGGAIGQFVYPFLIPVLVGYFGWRGSLVILSGMSLQICIIAMLIRPGFKEQRQLKLRSKNSITMQEISMSKETEEEITARNIQKVENNGILRITKELLCDPRYTTYCFMTFLFMAGSSVGFAYLVGYAKKMGLEEWKADFLLSVVGGFSLFGRIFWGIVGQVKYINSLVMYSVAISVTGIGMVIVAVFPDFYGCLTFAVIFGFFYAASGPVAFEVMCRLFDTRRFTVAVGYANTVRGIGITVGGPLAGLVYEATSFFPSVFYFGGASCLLGGVLGIFLYFINILLKK